MIAKPKLCAWTIGLFFLFIGNSLSAQYLDLAKVEMTYVPGDNANFSYINRRILINAPFKTKKDDAYIFAGIEYANATVRLEEEVDSFDKSEAENFNEINLKFAYTWKTRRDWRMGFQISPALRSNLAGPLERGDLLISGLFAFVIDKKDLNTVRRPWRVIFGFAYTSISRTPIPFPFISYYRKFHPKWSYNIGAPVTNVQFHASERHRVKFFAQGEGLNAHIQDGVIVNDEIFADRLRILLVSVGYRYEYNISEHIESYINITRTIFSDFQLRNGLENVFTPVIDNAMHYQLGIRLKI